MRAIEIELGAGEDVDVDVEKLLMTSSFLLINELI
jgi:hypothetical protein